MKQARLRYAGVFLVTKEGRVILQLRDKIRGIYGPGRITTFGGGVEAKESTMECALREIHEETGLILSEWNLRYLGPTKKMHRGRPVDCDFFYVFDVAWESLAVTEGKPAIFDVSEALIDKRLTPTCRRMLGALRDHLDLFFNHKTFK